ncbi:Transcriptional regulatory protein, C terminal [Deinococcus reticulitermitis]|uniref:Transcriptional regulatory protein, C terminal n=1 Tax=Deinococcus reticulitermitis TaxID=856736 RepID=A0A1H6ZRL4_9DEIO|nr:GAF domain-containing protein [Deinococcus reticulitermitis]SEJ55306.1 Transcriptional regulatory protein, C terminal [Deinococcus reticulitermitis]
MAEALLKTVSWAASTLTEEPRQLASVVRVLLTELRRVTGMDTAELYLADPQQTHLVLVGHAGRDAPAFSERCVFRFGEGFPGLAAGGRAPVETTRLESDGRYLREGVRALGYHAFLSYPLLTPHAVVGVLNLAAREVSQVTAAHRALRLIAPLLAGSLYCVMTSLGERTLQRVRQAASKRDRVLALLEGQLEASSALRATFRPLSGEVIETHPGEMPSCAGVQGCPAQGGQVCVSGMSELSCAAMPGQPHLICLPLWDGGEVRGVTSVQLPSRGALGSEAVAPLLWMSRLATGELGLAPPREPGTPPPWLDIETFGSFRVKRAGETLTPGTFKRRQAYQLLKVLVTRWGRPVQAGELCEALWPGEGAEERVLARLHVTLNALRQVLEPEEAQRGQVIVRDGAAYRFAPSVPYRLDAADFEVLIQQGDAQSGDEALASYAQALKLYRGDYLEDDPYAESFALERDYLRELAVHALFRSAELHEAAGRTQDALTAYARILTIDPLHFEAHEALIAFLVARDRLDDAQQRWERYARAYGGVPPLPPPRG